MPIVEAKCMNCGAALQVDNTKDAAVCPYCQTPFIIEKAINNYNISNNITAGTVNIIGGNSADFEIRAGTLLKYNGAATDVVIPNSVTSIDKEAFKGCTGLTSVTIPDSVTRIGDSTFDDNTGLTSVKVSAGNPIYHSSGNCLIETASKTLIRGCNASVIPSNGSVTSIGGSAFYGCTGLTSITIPDSVTSIGNYAFSSCTGLTNVTIPDSVTSIGSSAFYGCTGLTSVTIPDSVTSIGNYAFSGCTGLTSVTIPGGVSYIGEAAFIGCTGLTSVTIGKGVTSISDSAFLNCTGLTSVTIPDSVTSIGKWAFGRCTGLTSITIPDSVTSIGKDAFERCTGLTSVTIPDSVTIDRFRIFAPETKIIRPSDKSVTVEKPKGSSGCYVATAVYGSYDCPQVWTLRRFRDNRLALTWYGRLFIVLYYAISPTVVKWFGQAAWFNRFWRARLDRMVRRLQADGFDDTPYSDN